MGMYDDLVGRVFCPFCMVKTKHIIQVKVFDGNCHRYSIYHPPFHLFGKYLGRKYLKHHYTKYYRKKFWYLYIESYGRCIDCGIHWNGDIIYRRRPKLPSEPYQPEWRLFEIMMEDVWADSLVGAMMHEQLSAGKYENRMSIARLNYLKDLGLEVDWEKRQHGSMKGLSVSKRIKLHWD